MSRNKKEKTVSNHTLPRSDLCDTLCDKFDLKRQQSINLVEAVLNEIVREIVQEWNVKISSFGVFYVRQKNQRIGRNPKTGKEAMITARKSLSFRSSHILKAAVNKGQKYIDIFRY